MSATMDAVMKFYQVYNDHNPALWNEAMSPSYVGHVNGATIPSRDVGAGFITGLLQAFPDIKYTVDDSMEDGNKASCRWSATATHTGDLFGMPPTQKKVTMIGITFFRVENGQVAELWDVWDESGLMKQLGAA